MARDWSAIEREKRQFWVERLAAANPDEAFEIADELRQEVLAVRPDWPTAEERSEDLKAHEALSALIRRASPRRPG